MTQQLIEVTGGVDTHRDTHTVAAVDVVGRVLGSAEFAADAAGHVLLLAWLHSMGRLVRVGVEGTGAYGAGLTRHLQAEGLHVVEVDRPDRRTRRRQGKSDPIDAIAAAQAALSGRCTGVPKDRTGPVEALRNLRAARSSAVTARAEAQQRMKSLLVTAPDATRARLCRLPVRHLVATCAASRPHREQAGDPATAVMIALRSLARRHQQLTEEITELDQLINPLITSINPNLLTVTGVGFDVAGQLLVTAGENTDRLHSEAAFAMLCGAAPLPASSGRTNRHRLNRGGDRQANRALWRIALTRMAHHDTTRAYVERRTKDGLSKKEIIRCLKRYIAREIYALLTQPHRPEPNA